MLSKGLSNSFLVVAQVQPSHSLLLVVIIPIRPESVGDLTISSSGLHLLDVAFSFSLQPSLMNPTSCSRSGGILVERLHCGFHKTEVLGLIGLLSSCVFLVCYLTPCSLMKNVVEYIA